MPGRWRGQLRTSCAVAGLAIAVAAVIGGARPAWAARPGDGTIEAPRTPAAVAPQPRRVQPSTQPVGPRPDAQAALASRLKRVTAVKSWGYQLVGLNLAAAAASPFDLIVIDATTGLDANRMIRVEEVERLKRKPDGSRRLVIAYLSIGESEDYRPEYFSAEYLLEEAPDWLGKENQQWRGNRTVRFCHEGWQRTIIGDDDGRSVYNSLDPSPVQRLVELGFDGVYLDRADVYAEIRQDCPDGERKMVDFIGRIAAAARRRDPGFLVILQNAEELARFPKLVESIDGIAKEDLFYGADHTQGANSPASVKDSVQHLTAVKAAGRLVLVVDYLIERDKKADAKRRIEEHGFVPYIAPRDLGRLWLPGRDF